MSWSVGELARRLGTEILGKTDLHLRDVATLEAAGPEELSFVDSRKAIRRLGGCQAGALIVAPSEADAVAKRLPDVTRLIAEEPQAAFVQAMLLFRPIPEREAIGISEHAQVSASAQIGEGTNIHPGVVIGADVTIGKDCDLHPGVVVGAGTQIGDGCCLYPNAVVYPGSLIGNRVILHANSVIGADGFGYRFHEGHFEKLPHRGCVVIEDDVEIGACATVDRAMVGKTTIGTGTKIDNLVMIAHNCSIGRHNAFASQVGLAGSTSTGDYVRCGGQAGAADHLRIGHGASLGAKAGIMNDVPDGVTVYGSPAQPEKDAIRHELALRKVPQMREQMQELQRQLQDLQDRVTELSTAPVDGQSAA